MQKLHLEFRELDIKNFDIKLYAKDWRDTMAETTELMTVDNICNRVYIIRGQQVMLDYELAEIYGYEVKRLNEQVKRNIARFPEDFMFQLTKDEIDFVKSQISTSRNEDFSKSQFATLNVNGDKRGTNVKKLPYVFTEQGIYMLATVLIIRVFYRTMIRNGNSWSGKRKIGRCRLFDTPEIRGLQTSVIMHLPGFAGIQMKGIRDCSISRHYRLLATIC